MQLLSRAQGCGFKDGLGNTLESIGRHQEGEHIKREPIWNHVVTGFETPPDSD